MDNSPSPEKIAANRANAQKSTGPKTPAGRLQFEWRGRPYDFTTPPEPWFTQFIASDL